MSRGIGNFLWQISVALYLIANGVLGINKGGDFAIIYRAIFDKGDFPTVLAVITAVIALVAGIALILELFEIQLSFLDLLIFIIAIVWVVYIIVEIIFWISGKGVGGLSFKRDFWHTIQQLAVHLMVLASLLVASKKFA
jgi:hypothetical protein